MVNRVLPEQVDVDIRWYAVEMISKELFENNPNKIPLYYFIKYTYNHSNKYYLQDIADERDIKEYRSSNIVSMFKDIKEDGYLFKIYEFNCYEERIIFIGQKLKKYHEESK